MTLLAQLRRSLAASLLGARSSRADPRVVAWAHGFQGRPFSSSSDSEGPSSSDADSGSDDEQLEAPAGPAAASPDDADVYNPVADFAAGGTGPRRRRAAEEAAPAAPAAAAPAWKKVDGGFPVSQRFAALVDRMRDVSEEQIVQEAEAEEAVVRANATAVRSAAPGADGRRRPDPGSFQPLQRAGSDDFLLLAEAIEAYFSVAPGGDARRDGITPFERAALAALAAHIRDEHGDDGRSEALPPELAVGSPLARRVVNMAPPGRLAWEILGVEEDRGAVHWAVDLTDGKAPDPWVNARLSEEAKQAMWEAHREDPKRYTVDALARAFKVRRQRVLAILALKELEAGDPEAGSEEAEAVRRGMEEGVWGCFEPTGSGERHVVTVPSYPAYAQADPSKILSRLEAVVGKPAAEIGEADLTPAVAEAVLGVLPQGRLEEELAAAEEAAMEGEFKAALDYNMGRTGAGLARAGRKTKARARPEGGWPLLVKPLGGGDEEPYVATPDGEKRELSPDEALEVERQTPRPRRRIL